MDVLVYNITVYSYEFCSILTSPQGESKYKERVKIYYIILCREKFIAECEEFSSTFDLTGKGKRKREAGKKAKLEELIKNTEKLTSGAESTLSQIKHICLICDSIASLSYFFLVGSSKIESLLA